MLHASSASIALDRSAIPRGFALFRDVNGIVMLLLSMLLLSRVLLLPRQVRVPVVTREYLGRWLWPNWMQNVLSAVNRPLAKMLVFVKLCLRVVIAKTALLLGSVYRTVVRTLDLNPAEELDIKDWKVCVLDERENLSGGIIKYRFELPNPAATIPLYVGQEVSEVFERAPFLFSPFWAALGANGVPPLPPCPLPFKKINTHTQLSMCSIDARDRVLKESFFPVSSSNARGYFDVLVRRGASESTAFTKTLETLALGDELAFKGGRYRLNYLGQDDPISSMTVVASGLGVSPTLQILRGILSDRDSTVDDIELLWLNENSEDFVCESEVESLELRHIEKLVVTRVIEGDIYGRDLLKNEQVQDSVSPYEEGRVAIICTPDYIASTLRTLFQDLGYPAENILTITQE